MDPGPLRAVRRLKGPDFVVALQRQRDLVETFEQPVAPPRVDLETVPFSRGRGDGLLLQIDANTPCPLRVLDLRRKAVDNLLVDHDGKDSILEAVGEKDIAEPRADDGTDPHLLQRPHRPFAGRAATEIRSGDQDFRLTIGLAVQDKLWVLRTVRQIAQRSERPFAETAANGVSDETLDTDDDVRINVGAHDRCGNRRQFGERFRHARAPSSARRRWRLKSPMPPPWLDWPDVCGRAAPGGR